MEQAIVLGPQSNGHVKLWPELHVGDSGSLLPLCSEKPGVTLGLQSHPAPSPIDVPRGVMCTGCSIQQPAGEGAPHFPPLPSWGFSESKLYPLPQDLFLVHRQGGCMRLHAAGAGAVPPFPQLCSCPVTVTTVRAAFSHGHPLPLTPSPKVLVQPAAHFVRFLCRINICICSEPLFGTSFPPAV